MAKPVTTDEILLLINERDKHTQTKLMDILDTQQKTAETLDRVCNHIIISEEDKKHDAEFKKEVREHMRFSLPILLKSKDYQESMSSIWIKVATVAVLALLGYFWKFK